MSYPFQSALQVHRQRSQLVRRITTGSTHLDSLLGGGIETGSITEIVGGFHSGKTTFCRTLAVTCQLPLQAGGGGGKCLYIDTEDATTPQHLICIAERYRLNAQEVVDDIEYSKASELNFEQQTLLLMDVVGSIMAETQFSMLIIDSWASLFAPFHSGLYPLSVHQAHIGRFGQALQRLATERGIAVVVTNQVMPNSNVSSGSFARDEPIAGNIIGNMSATQIQLQKTYGNIHTCRIYHSPCLPDKSSFFAICADGIRDLD